MTKYEQVAEEIKSRIFNGQYKVKEQLPLEKEICDEFAVSKMTVKKALDILVTEGYIIKRRGSGSFVKDVNTEELRERSLRTQISGFTRTHSGENVSTKVLEFNTIFADDKIAKELNIEDGDLVCVIERVRYVDDEPMVIEKTYMPLSIVPKIKRTVVEDSIYKFVELSTGLKVQSSHSTVRADIAKEKDKEYLKLKDNEPVLEVERTAYLEDGTIFEYSFSRHRYDKFEFKAVIFNK